MFRYFNIKGLKAAAQETKLIKDSFFTDIKSIQ